MINDIQVELVYGLDAGCPAHELRHQVFVVEQQIAEEFDAQDADAWHAVLYCAGEPVACGRVFAEDAGSGRYHLGRFAVHKDYRLRGFGRLVLAALEQKAVELGAVEFTLDSQLHAAGFYERCGYERVTEVYELVGIPHVTMCKISRPR